MRKSLKYSLLMIMVVLFMSCEDDPTDPKPIEVETGEVEIFDYESAVVTGKIIEFGKGIDEYGHCWSTNPIPSIDDDKTVVSVEVGGDFQSEISSLLDGVKYYFRAYAQNDDEIVYGEIKELTTEKYLLPIVELEIDSVHYEYVSGNIHLESLGGYEQIEKIGICLSVNSEINLSDSVFTINTNLVETGKYSFKVEGLIDGQNYFINAFAINDKGSSFSLSKNFTTPEYELAQVSIRYIRFMSTNSLKLAVDVIDFGGYDTIINNGICWSETINPTIDDNCKFLGSSSAIGEREIQIDELDSTGKYYFRTFAINGKGITYSEEISKKMIFHSLVAYYPFNGNADDYTENANHGIVNGAALASNRFGNTNSAYSFDGINNYIDLKKSIIPIDGSDFSISIWTSSRNTEPSEVRHIIGQYDGALAGRFQIYEIDGHYKVFYGPTDLSGGNAYILDAVINNEWVNLVLTVEDNNLNVYKDGILMGENLSIGPLADINTFIGKSGSYDRYYKGEIDDVRIYNRPLTEEEIQLLYHEGGWEE